MPRVCSPSMAELSSPVALVPRQIRRPQACFEGVVGSGILFGEVLVWPFCFLCVGSSIFSDDSSHSLLRVRFFHATDGVGGGSIFPRSSVGWSLAAVDASSPPFHRKVVAGDLSSSMMRLGGVLSAGCWGLQQCLMPLAVVGGGFGCLLWRTGVPAATGRICWFGVACVISKLRRDLSLKWSCTVVFLNINPFLWGKKYTGPPEVHRKDSLNH
jgi:hypothetical protein